VGDATLSCTPDMKSGPISPLQGGFDAQDLPHPRMNRPLLVSLLIAVAAHAGLIWGLQSNRAPTPPVVLPAPVMVELLETRPAAAPAPQQAPAAAAPLPPSKPVQPTQQKTQRSPELARPTPAERAPRPEPQVREQVASTAPSSASPPVAGPSIVEAQVSPSTAPAGAGNSATANSAEASPRASAPAFGLQLPSSSADYLQNPKPRYPPLSERLGETGRVIHKVMIGVDGRPQSAELVDSSGFARLDKAAHETVMRWRYVPGKRNGVPEAMPVNVPIHWELPR
jgi:periplasmic protein TonB